MPVSPRVSGDITCSEVGFQNILIPPVLSTLIQWPCTNSLWNRALGIQVWSILTGCPAHWSCPFDEKSLHSFYTSLQHICVWDPVPPRDATDLTKASEVESVSLFNVTMISLSHTHTAHVQLDCCFISVMVHTALSAAVLF